MMIMNDIDIGSMLEGLGGMGHGSGEAPGA